MTEQDKLLLALENFETTVELDALRINFDGIKRVISENPKVAYYLEEMNAESSFFSGFKLRLHFKYGNSDVPERDIHIISDSEEFQSLLCQYIGNYKKRLVLIVDGRLDVNAEFEKFKIINAAFYPNFVSVNTTEINSSLIAMPIFDFQFQYRIGRVKLEMMENAMDAEVERIAKMLFLPSMNDETKAFLAHNYLAYTIKYTLNEDASSLERSYLQSAYGALINQKCVCQGYAEAFKRLMDYAGVRCDIVCGQIKGSDEHHAWNIIRLNGGSENYHIDVTWDSTGGRVSYEYFGLKDSDLAPNRIWNTRYNARCNSTRNLLVEGRRGIMKFKPRLLANGASTKILGY